MLKILTSQIYLGIKNLIKNKTIKGVIMVLTLFSTCIFLSAYMPQQNEEWIAPEAAKKKKSSIKANEVSIAEGKKVYKSNCLSCHGKEGKGDGPKSEELSVIVTDMTTAKVQAQTDGELFWKINEGRKPMPSYKRTLTVDQHWEVINYIRTLEKKEHPDETY